MINLPAIVRSKGLLAKFRVSRLPSVFCLNTQCLYSVTLKGTHSTCYGQKIGAIGQLGRPIEGKDKAKKMVSWT